MREIPLTRGHVALVDDEDYEALAAFKWRCMGTGHPYACRDTSRVLGPRRLIQMHRVILSAPDGVLVDHVSGNGLDNRRANLRLANHSQNRINSPRRDGTSIFRGVSWHVCRQTWQATIGVDGKKHFLGVHPSEMAAALAYDDAARRLHGEFARLNFPDGSTLPGKDAVREGHASIQGGPR